jgi:hypothetical protein
VTGISMNMTDTPEIIIQYKDSEGNILKRTISDITLDGDRKINAFCHLRNDIRTFHIANIEHIIDPKTGNIEKNPWKYFGLTESVGIMALVHQFLPAIKALKIFSKLIRGFSKRERMHIVRFIIDVTKMQNYSENDLMNGFKNFIPVLTGMNVSIFMILKNQILFHVYCQLLKRFQMSLWESVEKLLLK